jgi:hypothetical protein
MALPIEGNTWEMEDRAARLASVELANSMTKLGNRFPLPRFANPQLLPSDVLPLYTEFASNPENEEAIQKLQKIIGDIYAVFSRNSYGTLVILNETYFSTPENFKRNMAEDKAESCGKHLR